MAELQIPNQTRFSNCSRTAIIVVCLLLSFSLHLSAMPDVGRVTGKILDPHGAPVTEVLVKLLNSAGRVICEAKSDGQGNFILDGVEPGEYQLTAEGPTFVSVTFDVSISRGQQKQVTLQFRQLISVSQSITVVASAPSLLTPDPAQTIVIHDQVLDANPGRPGAPISIPGLPIETASGGIKAPQYFAPGVAGDHGEPIAQYFQIGDFLYPNNLPANAHGNGYADPNFLIASTIEAVTVDGGAFNVREGNNSVDLAASYVPREHFNSFVQITGDYRDADVMAGWSPSNPKTNAWLAMEASEVEATGAGGLAGSAFACAREWAIVPSTTSRKIANTVAPSFLVIFKFSIPECPNRRYFS